MAVTLHYYLTLSCFLFFAWSDWCELFMEGACQSCYIAPLPDSCLPPWSQQAKAFFSARGNDLNGSWKEPRSEMWHFTAPDSWLWPFLLGVLDLNSSGKEPRSELLHYATTWLFIDSSGAAIRSGFLPRWMDLNGSDQSFYLWLWSPLFWGTPELKGSWKKPKSEMLHCTATWILLAVSEATSRSLYFWSEWWI